MDPELRDTFRNLGDQVASLRREMVARFERIESRVFGSEPPINGYTNHAPVVKRVSQAEGDVSELAGRVMRVESMTKQTQSLLEHNTAETQATKLLLERNTAATEKIQTAVTGIVNHPRVRLFLSLLSTAILGWLASKGVHQ